MNFKNLVIASALILSPFSVHAYDVGVGVKGGTTGVGIDLSMTLTDTINVRLSSTSYDFGSSSENFNINSDNGQSVASINSDLSVDFGAVGLLFDWYVFDGTFHVTGGMVKNNSALKLKGALSGTDVTFGGTKYNVASQFSDPSLTGDIKLGDSFEPYFGIGWGRKASADSGLSLSVELGVMLLSPTVDLGAPILNASGLANLSTATNGAKTTQADFESDVKQAEADVKSELANLEMWPVLSIGLNYAF